MSTVPTEKQRQLLRVKNVNYVAVGAGGSYSQQQKQKLKIMRMRKPLAGMRPGSAADEGEILRKQKRATMTTPKCSAARCDERTQPNLRELLKEVYQVIKRKKEEKLSVDTIVVVNTPQIVQQNGNNSKKKSPICIDLRSQRKCYLKERSTNAQI